MSELADGWAFAKELSDALLKVRPLGGSELFVKRNGQYFADPKYCGAAIEDSHKSRHEVMSENVRLLRRVRALEDQLSAIPTPAQCVWHPIETAPKDGTNVLVCRSMENKSVGEAFFWEGAWRTWDGENHTRTSFIGGYLTHWQPLPDATTFSSTECKTVYFDTDLSALADRLVGIQEDLPSENDRAALGEAAHYLRKYSVPRPARGGIE